MIFVPNKFILQPKTFKEPVKFLAGQFGEEFPETPGFRM